MNRPIEKLHGWSQTWFILALGLLVGNAGATQPEPLPWDPNIDLADLPLQVVYGVPPNIILTLDDSTSMDGLIVPTIRETKWLKTPDPDDDPDAEIDPPNGVDWTPEDVLTGTGGLFEMLHDLRDSSDPAAAQLEKGLKAALHSSKGNGIHYDRCLSYSPPLKANGRPFDNMDFNKALDNGFDETSDEVDLASEYAVDIDAGGSLEGPFEGEAAYYYRYKDGNPDCEDDVVSGECDDAFFSECYERIMVSATSGPKGSDEKTNFANWYSFYRTRLLATKTALSRTFAELNSNVRVGRQTINDVYKSSVPDPQVSEFRLGNRKAFYDWLKGVTTGKDKTPLISAMVKAGDYLSTETPYRDDPDPSKAADPDNKVRSCRQNFHLLFTDGGWQESSNFAGKIRTLRKKEENLNSDGKDIKPMPVDIDGQYSDMNYEQDPPYYGSVTSTLADHAFHYWATDLLPDVRNDVPNRIDKPILEIKDGESIENKEKTFWDPSNDPARWQHMVTYAIGLGVDGLLNPERDCGAEKCDWEKLKSGEKGWGDNNIDDLWHAAVNSRGEYFSVKDPGKLIDKLAELMASFNTGSSSAASLAASSSSMFDGTLLYHATFDTEGWTGDLVAYTLSNGDGSNDCNKKPVGTLCEPEDDPKWSAAELLRKRGPSDRQILSYAPKKGGVAFKWDALSEDQRDWLQSKGEADYENAKLRVEYLRGDTSNDGIEVSTDVIFRDRFQDGIPQLLGDIVNSAPLYVGPPRRAITEEGYDKFRDCPDPAVDNCDGTGQADRRAMVYVGANDGMLHAFDASTGEELFAYVPFSVFPHLAGLTDNNYYYKHKFFVDAPLVEGDAHTADGWKTVLVGGLGHGGQGVFALDITDPDEVSQNTADTKVLWEFTDRDDRDMGYLYGRPSIVSVPAHGHGTKWMAVFGNGYNSQEDDGNVSAEGDAALYLVEFDTDSGGPKMNKVLVEKGRWDDPLDMDCNGTKNNVDCQGRANGLSTVTAVDMDADQVVDAIYAGDLFGNLWKFQDKNGKWEVALGGKPLFKAQRPETASVVQDDGSVADEIVDNHPQPITTKIRVVRHPRGQGVLVLFGTGKYLGQGDGEDTSIQSFYGVWDRDGEYQDLTRNDLLQQEILKKDNHYDSDTGSKVQYRVISDNQLDWTQQKGWYLDLVVRDGTAEGERVTIQDPVVRNNMVIFVSLIPNDDPCEEGGGDSWVNVLDYRDGSRLAASPFDVNQDGLFGVTDLVTYDKKQVVIGSIKLGEEKTVYSAPTSIVSGTNIYNYLSEANGGKPVVLLESTGLVGRQWLGIH